MSEPKCTGGYGGCEVVATIYDFDPFVIEGIIEEKNPQREWWCLHCYSERGDEV